LYFNKGGFFTTGLLMSSEHEYLLMFRDAFAFIAKGIVSLYMIQTKKATLFSELKVAKLTLVMT